MKNLSVLLFAVCLCMSACNFDGSNSGTSIAENASIDKTSVRGENTQSNLRQVYVMLVVEDDDDEQVVTTIYTTLQAAEKVAQLLDVEMVASDEAISSDVFVFGLKTKDQKDLALRIFDDEGYEVANNTLEIIEGSNYRALNVQSLPDGSYSFELTDEAGKKLTKGIVVDRKAKIEAGLKAIEEGAAPEGE